MSAVSLLSPCVEGERLDGRLPDACKGRAPGVLTKSIALPVSREAGASFRQGTARSRDLSCELYASAAGHRCLGLGQLRPYRVDSVLELQKRTHLPGDKPK